MENLNKLPLHLKRTEVWVRYVDYCCAALPGTSSGNMLS